MERRSYDCSLDVHRDCAHRIGLGGGFNPSRRRLEFGEVLCRCSCHSACPLAGQDNVSPRDWSDSCSCPGAEREREAEARRGGRPPEFGEILRARRENRQRRHEAINAVRSRSAGRSRQEIRQVLVGELHSRKLDIPTDQVLDSIVDSIAHPPGPLNSVRLIPDAVRMVTAAGGETRRLLKLFKGVERVRDPSGGDPYFAAPGGTAPEIEVILDAGAESVLDTGSGQREPGVGDAHLLSVSLEPAVTAGPGAAVTVHVDAHRVGVLSQEDSLALEQALEAAAQQNQTLMMLGAYGPRAADGSSRLRIYPAGPRRR
jgi:hypothetical protein